MTTKVLIVSGSLDSINHNSTLRECVERGFQEVLGKDAVASCPLDIALPAARGHNPDLIVVFGSCMPDSSDYTKIRHFCAGSGAALAFWLHDDPYEFDFNFKIHDYADFIFSNDRWAVEHIDHPQVHHLPLAADSGRHRREISRSFVRDYFFCGVGFPNRVQLLSDSAEFLSEFTGSICGSDWPESRPFSNQRIDNSALPDIYNNSMVTLNIGRRFNLANRKYNLDATTPGPRTFEAALAGTVQCFHFVTGEIVDYFDEGTEILLFDSPGELKNLLTDMKQNPERRLAIATASQQRCLKDHTYANRARRILEVVG